jgi:hypothetical protein
MKLPFTVISTMYILERRNAAPNVTQNGSLAAKNDSDYSVKYVKLQFILGENHEQNQSFKNQYCSNGKETKKRVACRRVLLGIWLGNR